MNEPSGLGRAKGRILVVDDDEIAQMVLRELLSREGYAVDVAWDAEMAMKAQKTVGYDLLLLDYMLPGLNGLEAVKAIRSGQADVMDPEVQIIVLTSMDPGALNEACVLAGAQLVLNKPVDGAALLAAIGRLAGNDSRAGDSAGGEALPERKQIPANVMDRAINRFMEEIPNTVFELRQAADARDFDALARIAHRFRGGAALVGANVLASLAGRLESSARNKIEDEAARLVRQLTEALGHLQQAAEEQ